MKTRRFTWVYLDLFGDSNRRDPAFVLDCSGEYSKPLVTENKSVNLLLSLDWFNSSSVLLLLSLEHSSCDRFWLELQEDAKKTFDDDDFPWKSLRTNLILRSTSSNWMLQSLFSGNSYWFSVWVLIENWCWFESLLRWCFNSVTVAVFCYGGWWFGRERVC
jgi:hypothetical protein